MNFDHPTPGQLPALRQLWKTAFGDTDAYLDAFFCAAFSPLRCRCANIDGETAGMLFWFDCLWEGRKVAYLYAVATYPKHRGKGVCRGLIRDTHALLQSQGYAGALLVPESDSLRQMYASFGYVPATTISETFCAAAGDPAPIHAIDREEYALLRRQWLPKGSVIQEGENLAFLETQVFFYKGMDFLLSAQETKEGALFAAELLGNAAAAPGILRALGCPQGTFRTPGSRQSFAMFCPLAENHGIPAYFGLAFD